MSLHPRAKSRVRMHSGLLVEFEGKFRIYYGSMLSPFLFAVVVDVITELPREVVLCDSCMLMI